MLRRDVLATGLALAMLPTMASAQTAGAGTVNVLYAGSLVNLMEHGIGPAFDKAAGVSFRGYAGGSNKLANEIKGKLVPGDVFISANPKVNDDLMGAANGGWVDWYVTFAQSPLVIGYNPSSRFAADLKSKPWYEVLQEPGIRIGRTDPKLDPKGKLTLELLKRPRPSTRVRISRRRCWAGRKIRRRFCPRKASSAGCSRARSMSASSTPPRPPI